MATLFRRDSDEDPRTSNRDNDNHITQDGDGVQRSNSSLRGGPPYDGGAWTAQPISVSPLSSFTGSHAEDNHHPYADYTGYDFVDNHDPSYQKDSDYTRAHAEPPHHQGQHHKTESTLPRGDVAYHPVGLDNGGGGGGGASTALAPSPEPGTQQHPYRYHIFRRWGWEIFSLVLALLLLVAMVVILRVYEGQRVPDWGESFNLNTILALLSTFFRGLLVIVIAEIVSQAKWEWFGAGRTRPLQHLQDFDAAARGVWGALCLVPTALKDADVVTVIAALLLAISFGIGPTVQQTIRSSTCDIIAPGLDASIPYAHYVPRVGGFVRGYPGLRGSPDSDTSVAVSSSLNSPDGVENLVTPTCSTGNCTFSDGDPIPSTSSIISRRDDLDGSVEEDGLFGQKNTSYSTIGMCHMCMNVTSLISVVDIKSTTTYFGLPNGLNITHGSFGTEMNVTTADANLTWTGEDLMTPEFAIASRWSLVNMTMLTTSTDGCVVNGDDDDTTTVCPEFEGAGAATGTTNVRAATCILYPCLRTYVASVINGALIEHEIEPESGPPTPAAPDLGNDPVILSDADSILDSLQYGGGNLNLDYHYTTIKAPCHADGTTYATEEDMAASPNNTLLTLYETHADGSYELRNHSAPEACIYRHNAEFGYAVSKELRSSLEGACRLDPRYGPSCSRTEPEQSFYKPLEMLYSSGNASVASVDSYFASVARALTGRYRTTYGSAVFNDSDGTGLGAVYNSREPQALPLGTAEGVAWRTTVCTVVHWEWLAFSAALVVLTAVLLAVTIVRNWRERHVRPVWKNSLLPLLFHGDRFGLGGQGPLAIRSTTQGTRSKEDGMTTTHVYYNTNESDGSQKRLLETAQMEEQAKKIMTTFQ